MDILHWELKVLFDTMDLDISNVPKPVDFATDARWNEACFRDNVNELWDRLITASFKGRHRELEDGRTDEERARYESGQWPLGSSEPGQWLL